MHRSVRIPEQGADAQCNGHPHGYGDDTSYGQKYSHFQCVEAPKHDDGVDEHDEISAEEKKGIRENGISTNISITSCRVDQYH